MKLEDKLKILVEKGYTYDCESGHIYNRYNKQVTCKSSNGYIHFGTDFKVGGHQFAWYVHYNQVPNVIDHIDRCKTNNKIDNLRNGNQSQNLWNMDVKQGYSLDKNTNTYYAQICVNNKRICLGHHKTPEDARQAYIEAKKLYHKIN
jgi:hypothetical protein